jgi:hypothetical protein
MAVWRRDVGVATWRYGGLETRCGHDDVEVWSAGPRWRRAVVDTVEIWRFGDLEARRRCSGVDAWRYGVLEFWSSRGRQVKRSYTDVEVWRGP